MHLYVACEITGVSFLGRWGDSKTVKLEDVVPIPRVLSSAGALYKGSRYPRAPSIQTIPTLGPKVDKYYLHWVKGGFRLPRAIGHFGR